MQAIQEKFISEAEYLAMEEAALEKHEYFKGRIYAMAGASPAHNIISSNILGTLVSRLRGQPCRGAGSDQRVKIEATGLRTYPDVLIVCPPEKYDERDPNSLLNPRVIFEVLSPSTQEYDRSIKFDHYQQIESLTDYLIISQERVRVEHYQRGPQNRWTVQSYLLREDHVYIAELRLELPLEEIYDRLKVPAGLALLPDDAEKITDMAGDTN